MAIRTYDPKLTTVIFGPLQIQGFAEEKISVSYSDDSFDLAIGCDGEATRVRKNNNSATITVTLQQSSPSNDSLSVISIADRGTNVGMFPLTFVDGSGSTVAFAANAYIQKHPDLTYSNSNQTCQWVFITDNLGMFTGGNVVFGTMSEGEILRPQPDASLAPTGVQAKTTIPDREPGAKFDAVEYFRKAEQRLGLVESGDNFLNPSV